MKTNDITMRDAFCYVANKFHTAILVSGLMRKKLEARIAAGLPGDDKKQLKEIIDGLTGIEKAGKEGYQLYRGLTKIVYPKFDSGQTKVSLEE